MQHTRCNSTQMLNLLSLTVVLLLTLAISAPFLSSSPLTYVSAQTQLLDGQFVNQPSSNTLTQYVIELHSMDGPERPANLSSDDEKRVRLPTLPPLMVAWSAAGDSGNTPWPTIYASFLTSPTNSTVYDFMSNTGVLVLPTASIIGQYQMFLSVDQTYLQTPVPYSFGYSLFSAIQLQTCPSRFQTAFVEAEEILQFVVTAQQSQGDLTIMTDSYKNENQITFYISTQPHPSETNYMWTTSNINITISQSDPNFPQNGVFYIGTYGQQAQQFDMTVSQDNCSADTQREKIQIQYE